MSDRADRKNDAAGRVLVAASTTGPLCCVRRPKADVEDGPSHAVSIRQIRTSPECSRTGPPRDVALPMLPMYAPGTGRRGNAAQGRRAGARAVTPPRPSTASGERLYVEGEVVEIGIPTVLNRDRPERMRPADPEARWELELRRLKLERDRRAGREGPVESPDRSG